MNVLEPSCGSLEYVQKLLPLNVNITAVEKNKTIFQTIKQTTSDNLTLHNTDFIECDMKPIYNLIIGNPPYFVMSKQSVETVYHEYFTGRPNIFILFIVKSLQLLCDGGVLSFILPKNFLNCIYYNPVREYINNTCTIRLIEDCSNDSYIETAQDTIMFILQKTPGDNSEYIVEKVRPTYTIFNTKCNILTLRSMYTNSKTLDELGYKAVVGNIVWNQCIPAIPLKVEHALRKHQEPYNIQTHMIISESCTTLKKKSTRGKKEPTFPEIYSLCQKYLHSESMPEKVLIDAATLVINTQTEHKGRILLTHDAGKTRLIYSNDISNNQLKQTLFRNIKKGNYIHKQGMVGLALIVNRGYGVGKYSCDNCIVDLGKNEYLLENHVISILPKAKMLNKTVKKNFTMIQASLSDSRTASFINLYAGTNSLNTTELSHILPIYTT